VTTQSEVLFIGGRAGVGKSSAGYEIHAQLSAAHIRHCLIEGDNLDMAWPTPHEHDLRLAEQNLAAIWANYRAADYRRMIYTNTASILKKVISELTAAMGDRPHVTAVLLTCSDATARQRLARREIGSELDWHIERSAKMARRLDSLAPAWVHRVTTDSRTITDIAAEVIALTGWKDEQLPADRVMKPSSSFTETAGITGRFK
jgi:deoxyadenosine/deoxycytidine kinase